MPPSLEVSQGVAVLQAPAPSKRLVLSDKVIERSPDRKGKSRLPPRRDYGDQPLPIKPSDKAPKSARIIGRVAEPGHHATYTLMIGGTQVDDVHLNEILEFVSPYELEQYENRQFEEERAALAIAEAEAAAEEERRAERRKEKARRKGLIIREETEGVDEDSADGGRKRPSYKHLFEQFKQRRRRKRDAETGELIPFSNVDFEQMKSESSGDERPQPGPSLSLEQPKRRRRKRDPVTGELIPLSDRNDDVSVTSISQEQSGSAVAPDPEELPKRRRRKRDPVTGELIPLGGEQELEVRLSKTAVKQMVIDPADYAHLDHRKRPRRRRHPITGELMPLGWRYDPDKEQGSKQINAMSPSMRRLSISQQPTSKRIKLDADSSENGTSKEQTSPRRLTKSPGKAQPARTAVASIEEAESDELVVDDPSFNITSPVKSAASAQKTSIMRPIARSTSRSSSEQVTLASFLKSNAEREDGSETDEGTSSPQKPVKQTPTQQKTSILNPVANQTPSVDTSEEDDDEGDDDEYFVEAIVAHRTSNPKSRPGMPRVMLYHTKWEGHDELTWEPAESFAAADTVAQYRRRMGLDGGAQPAKTPTRVIPIKQNPSSGKGKSRSTSRSSGRNNTSVAQSQASAAKPGSHKTKLSAQPQNDDDDEDEDEGEEEDDYEVESILAHHMSDPRSHPGKPQTMLYKVKWKGWDEHTWEPITSFPDREVVNQYRRKAGLKPQ